MRQEIKSTITQQSSADISNLAHCGVKEMFEIDAKGVYFRDLNRMVREAVKRGEKEIVLKNVNGQYYIGDGIREEVRITIEGVPGNDLAAFMDGPTIVVKANAQDNIGNTMNSGKVIVEGYAGDVLGYGMRGGKLYIKGDVGYRVGIHMKGYKKQIPVIVAGGTAGDFFGEYMAGGVLVLLGLNAEDGKPIVGDYLGSGMHGGMIFIRGEVEKYRCGAEVGIMDPDEKDIKLLKGYLTEFCNDFNLDLDEVMKKPFKKLIPVSLRPYGNLYAY
jgi:glutamate synthase domain-containing protein 3